ncbi:hypothetical protein BTN50_0360 [Candidatus Enterovibrio altilux]|uniref:Uncharacterized protein n=1 Tax=Candidatus Enterovibrio altilux TaxID=1927128 RepID=A0A291B7B7_9GAMM|nr:hypothetical protein BTN50_0360 [Candidatus Enterovibrio luxaltus]
MQYYETVRIKRMVPLIPPREGAILGNEIIQVIYQLVTRNYMILINVKNGKGLP